MKGNGNLIGGKDHTERISSSYTATFKGMKPRFSSKALGLDALATCTQGVIIPDPVLMSAHKTRRSQFE